MNVSLAETQISIGGVERVKEKEEAREGWGGQRQLWDRPRKNNVDVESEKRTLLLCRK